MAGRLLLVSYCYPPLAAPESWLSAKAVRSLQLVGYEVDVVCATPAWWHSVDDSLVTYSTEAARRVIRVRTPRWIPMLQPHPWLRQFPDVMRFMQPRVLRAIDSLDLDDYDAVMTWSQWHSTHLIGLAIKRRRPDLRWIAHFSDPWLANPLQPRHRLARARNEVMEREVLAEADVVEFTTAEARDLTLAPYPAAWAARTVVVPHVIDGDLFGEDVQRDPRRIVVRHIGSFYGARRPDALFGGIVRLRREHPDVLVDVTFELIGSMDRSIMQTPVAKALPAGFVRMLPPVQYRASLRLMREADLLVVADAPAVSNVFMASKLVDYIGARRPVLGLTPPGSAARLIEHLGGWSADPLDPAGVAEALRAALVAVKARRGDDDWGAAAERERHDRLVVGRLRQSLIQGTGTR